MDSAVPVLGLDGTFRGQLAGTMLRVQLCKSGKGKTKVGRTNPCHTSH